jgi:hypothetical protein
MKEIMESKGSATEPLSFTIDGEKDTVLALKVLDDHLAKVLEEPLYWKWAVLALHNALQGFMVLNLADSCKLDLMQDARSCPECHREVLTAICPGCNTEIEVFGKRSWGSRSEWNNYFLSLFDRRRKNCGAPKDWRLIPFLEMFGRIRNDKYMKRFLGSKKCQLNKRQKKSVTSLHNDLRNEFIHFKPRSYPDDAPALLSEVKEILPIISFLAFESGNIPRMVGKDGFGDTTRELLEKLNNRVAALEKAYSSLVASRLQSS